MAQHDYVIDNQSAPSARADINSALQAIVTQNSGASAPTTTYPDMFWYDTANNQIKKRNEANSAWITLGTVDEATNKFTPNSALTTAGIDPATLVVAAEGIASNNNDTTIPTSAAVKAYTDTAVAGISTVPPDASVSRVKLKTGTNSGSYSWGSSGGTTTISLDAYSFFPSHSGVADSVKIEGGGASADLPAITFSDLSTASGTVRWRYILA